MPKWKPRGFGKPRAIFLKLPLTRIIANNLLRNTLSAIFLLPPSLLVQNHEDIINKTLRKALCDSLSHILLLSEERVEGGGGHDRRGA